MSEYKFSFNQDFTSVNVLSPNGYRIFSIGSMDNVDEILAKESEHIRILERLFNSYLIVLVNEAKPYQLRMVHFKKKHDICNCVYPSEILCVRMNRSRLIVCLAEGIHIHDIRDMKSLHSIQHNSQNDLGLCTLSLNSHLAYPISNTTGELQIFNASKLKPGIKIQAHETPLSAISFSPNGILLATASERGTVIRVFCVKNGHRVQEFRRGVKRCVRIGSLVFSSNADFLCASSNTETIHIFKIDSKAVEYTERKSIADSSQIEGASSMEDINGTQQQQSDANSWSGYLSKAVSSYFPSQVCDVFNQDRAFATAVLSQPGMNHVCGLARIVRELRLLVASADGFLYIYDLNESKGGGCKLITVHDLRNPLDGVVELGITKISDRALDSRESAEQTDDVPNPSYAGILKGNKDNNLTESAKYRSLCDAIETPTKIFEEHQFPPVTTAIRE